MHLRMPSISQGVQAGIWAVFFGLIIIFGSIAVDVDAATAWIVGAISAAVIFFLVRLRGGEELRPPRS